MANLIVSTIGTSLLTNHGKGNVNTLLRDTANLQLKELSLEQRETIDSLARELDIEFSGAGNEELRRASAELNGILGYYGDEINNKQSLTKDIHFLLTTDTYQGQKAASLVENRLHSLGVGIVEVLVPPGLSTRNHGSFSLGINHVVQWCEETLPGYAGAGYRIVFNLVGGFKSLQGYMNTLGMFYAHEIIYIFEAPSADLIRIPRLPVTLDEVPVLKEKAALFALMVHGHLANREEVEGIPEIFLDSEQGSYTLSTWGLFIWEHEKQAILGDHLRQYPGLIYEKSFEKDFENIRDKARRADLQSTLAKVSLLFRSRGLEGLCADTGLIYTNYQGVREKSIGHFRLNQDWRVSCQPSDGFLCLRHVGSHDYVNGNP